MYKAEHISQSIERDWRDVYDFASNPENLPQWASGLSRSSIRKSGEVWVANSPMGEVKIKFAERNDYGVLDHDVTLPSGEVNHNPLRVVKNGSGCEVIFTLYWLENVSDADFKKDAQYIAADLRKLKEILEK